MKQYEDIRFTEDGMYLIFDVWYDHDDIFKHIARGLVQAQVAKGLNIDGHFVMEIVRLANNGWCKPRPVEA